MATILGSVVECRWLPYFWKQHNTNYQAYLLVACRLSSVSFSLSHTSISFSSTFALAIYIPRIFDFMQINEIASNSLNKTWNIKPICINYLCIIRHNSTLLNITFISLGIPVELSSSQFKLAIVWLVLRLGPPTLPPIWKHINRNLSHLTSIEINNNKNNE